MLPAPAAVLASRYVRAWRTAELLAEEAGWPAPKQARALEAEREPSEVLPGLKREARTGPVALVGHEPHLGRLASLLMTGDPDTLSIDLKKGGTIVLMTLDVPAPGEAILQALLTPRALRRLAG